MTNIKKNYLYNIALTLTNILFPIVTFPYVSRLIGPTGIGKIQFIISFAQYFALFAGLGIPLYGIREVAKYKADKEKLSKAFSELIIIYLISSILVSAVYLMVILTFNYFSADRPLYIFSLSIILMGFSSIDWLYSGLEDFKTISVRSMIIKILSVAAVFTFIKSGADYTKFLYISIFSILGNNIINLILINNTVAFTVKSLFFKQHFKPLIYIFSTTLATSMYTVLDTVLLGFLSNVKSVGLYTAAIKLTKISLPFITSVGAVTLPVLSKGFYNKDDDELKNLLQKSFDFIVLFATPITVGSFLLAKQFIILFSGSGFIEAVIPMKILSLLPILIGLGFFFGFQVLVPASKDKQLFTAVIIGMVSGVLLNFLLVPVLQASGGALANVLTEFIVTLSYYFFVKRGRLFNPNLKSMFNAIISSLIFVPVYFLFELLHLNIIIDLILTVTTCALCYGLIQTFIFKNHLLLNILKTMKEKLIAYNG